MVTGDFDGDGTTDVAVLDHDVAKTFLGASDGRLRAGPVTPNVGPIGGPLTGRAAADVDDDGLDDVISVNGEKIVVLYGRLDGGLEPPVETPCSCHSTAVDDLDADALPDLAVARSGNGIRLLRNTSAPELRFSGGLRFGGVALGDSDESFIQVEHTGDLASLLRSLQIDGAHAADFSVLDMDCLGVYFRDDLCNIFVRFAPSAEGARSPMLVVDSDAAAPQGLALEGTGVRTAAPAPKAPAASPPPVAPPPVAGAALAKPSLRGATISAPVTCPPAAIGACSGTVTIRTSGSKPLAAGRTTFSIAAGKRVVVKVRLTRAARTLLARRGRLSLVATVAAADGRKARVTVKRAFVVRAKRG